MVPLHARGILAAWFLTFVFCLRDLDSQSASEPGRILVLPENRDLAVIFQDLALWPHLTVDNNLGFGLEAKKVPRAVRRELIASG